MSAVPLYPHPSRASFLPPSLPRVPTPPLAKSYFNRGVYTLVCTINEYTKWARASKDRQSERATERNRDRNRDSDRASKRQRET